MPRPLVDGILNLNKPIGITSMDAVRVLKRISQVKRVGHAGTLDPIATGVLPICFGQAARLMEYLVDGRKVYKSEFTMGVATDTYDAHGETVSSGVWSNIAKEEVQNLFPQFLGTIGQKPPMYSALKHEGKRLYQLARAGVEVERPEREVVVHRLDLLGWNPPQFIIEVECGRGFYMRTLAHDMGVALGCGAHLSALERLQAGPFSVEHGITLKEFEVAANNNSWESLLSPPDSALLHLEGIVATISAERRLRDGQAVTLAVGPTNAQHLEPRRVYGEDNRFIGIARLDRSLNQWQPEKLFRLQHPSQHAPATNKIATENPPQ
jgi:tRNA pseudouridine55 synthase